MSIAVEIHRVSRGALTDPAGRLETVRVAVGELSAVDPTLLGYAWEALIRDGPDADARLDVEWHPTRQYCGSCGEDKPRAEGRWLRVCPDCSMPLQVEGGRELDVVQVCWRTPDV
ncbi:MAG: hydrogenase maturation nickel metallochaperone HypA [Planctomycetota bacterium]|jgi:Zn finger protein HypA/HybF involved in hydrogenase expression